RGARGGGPDPATPKGTRAGAGGGPPPSLYLRAPALTSPDSNIAGFAAASRDAAGGNVLNLLHLMLARLREDMAHHTASVRTATTAAQAFALKRGAGRDFAHIFIAAARSLGIPARYVGGHFRSATSKLLAFF